MILKKSKAAAAPAAPGLPAAMRTLTLAVDALLTGARIIPMGDNGVLFRELAARGAQRGRTLH
jgi:hypothetical protein